MLLLVFIGVRLSVAPEILFDAPRVLVTEAEALAESAGVTVVDCDDDFVGAGVRVPTGVRLPLPAAGGMVPVCVGTMEEENDCVEVDVRTPLCVVELETLSVGTMLSDFVLDPLSVGGGEAVVELDLDPVSTADFVGWGVNVALTFGGINELLPLVVCTLECVEDAVGGVDCDLVSDAAWCVAECGEEAVSLFVKAVVCVGENDDVKDAVLLDEREGDGVAVSTAECVAVAEWESVFGGVIVMVVVGDVVGAGVLVAISVFDAFPGGNGFVNVEVACIDSVTTGLRVRVTAVAVPERAIVRVSEAPRCTVPVGSVVNVSVCVAGRLCDVVRLIEGDWLAACTDFVIAAVWVRLEGCHEAVKECDGLSVKDAVPDRLWRLNVAEENCVLVGDRLKLVVAVRMSETVDEPLRALVLDPNAVAVFGAVSVISSEGVFVAERLSVFGDAVADSVAL